jgi:putative lipoic acid-binding regulatory protein
VTTHVQPLEFPCRFPVKALGPAAPDFDALVVEIVRRHCPALDPSLVTRRLSRGGKWVSVTVVIEAESRAQLNAIYQALSDHQRVHMAL